MGEEFHLKRSECVIRVGHTFLIADIEEHRLRVLENWVQKKVFGTKRDEVTGVEKTT